MADASKDRHADDVPEENAADSTALARTGEDALQQLSTNLDVTKRVLERADERYVRFFQRHPEFFGDLVSTWYGLSPDLITEFRDQWNWEYLSDDQELHEELIALYQGRWDWERLSWNESILWSSDLIDSFRDRWDWERLSENSSLPWSVALIERFKDQWDWTWLSGNESLPWDEDLIGRFEDQWDWGRG